MDIPRFISTDHLPTSTFAIFSIVIQASPQALASLRLVRSLSEGEVIAQGSEAEIHEVFMDVYLCLWIFTYYLCMYVCGCSNPSMYVMLMIKDFHVPQDVHHPFAVI